MFGRNGCSFLSNVIARLYKEGIIVMEKRRSKQEWMSLVLQYMNSGLSLTKWCKESDVSVSSIAPYVNQYATPAEILSHNQIVVEMQLPRNIEKSIHNLKSRSCIFRYKRRL